MSQTIEIGRLLRAGTTGFVIGCRVNQLEGLSFGALVKAPMEDDLEIFGLIHDIHIDDDGLVRQLITAESVEASVIADNRLNRNVPLEISVLSIGYRQERRYLHMLPLAHRSAWTRSISAARKSSVRSLLLGGSATSAISCAPQISPSTLCWRPTFSRPASLSSSAATLIGWMPPRKS